ncbi:MAG: hypothetical protein JKY88_09300 [Pseudomonadales bacterium]|nr:hypothetical protein [Pseudomonadales bacterium]
MSRDVSPNKLRFFLWTVLLLGSTGNAQGLVDPTAPLEYEEHIVKTTKEMQSLHLTSVIVGPKSKIAIINGRRYRESDQVGVYRLVNIQAKEVTLQKGQISVRLSLSSMRSEDR